MHMGLGVEISIGEARNNLSGLVGGGGETIAFVKIVGNFICFAALTTTDECVSGLYISWWGMVQRWDHIVALKI